MRRSSANGYSLIEVMTAVAIMTVGATGLVLMQGATTRGNIVAQEATVGVTVAEVWTERLKRESLAWSAAGTPTTPNLGQPAGTPYLAQATYGNESALFTHFGIDTSVDAEAKYHVRLLNTDLHNDTSGAVDLIRVDITVYWFRSVAGSNDETVSDLSPAGYTPSVLIPQALLDAVTTRKVYASVVLQPQGGR